MMTAKTADLPLSNDVPGQIPARFASIAATQPGTTLSRSVAQESPVAIEINGLGYAVLMASPIDLEDLLYGFMHAERIIAGRNDIIACDLYTGDAGIIIRVNVTPSVAERVGHRTRHRATDSSCGLCGIENLEQALRDLPRLPTQPLVPDHALFQALADLPRHQPLNHLTGAVHAAAWCDASGAIRLVREDVGRHNAFDKLIGAMLRADQTWDGGFALLSSRCSYELVEKAVLSNCPMLVTISAPTSLALAHADAAGLALRVLARPDAILSPIA